MKQEKKNLKTLKVEEFTTPCPVSVHPDTTLKELELLMNKEGIRHLPVVNSSRKIVGIISERDVHCAYRLGPAENYLAQDIMQKDPYVVDENTKLSEVAFRMSEQKIGSALVQNADGEMGIFTSTDALNALIEIVRGDLHY